MPYVPVNVLLDRPLKPRESLEVPYPNGMNEGSFFAGIRHTLGINGDFFRCPRDFIITTHREKLQFTWLGKRALPEGLLLNLQLEQPGNDFFVDPRSGTTVANMVASPLFLINLGAPKDKSLDHYLPEGFIESGGELPLLHFQPDIPRNAIIASTADDSSRVFHIEGEDFYGNRMMEEISGPRKGMAHGKKAFAKIARILVDDACAGEVSIGTGNRLGLPVFMPAPGYVLRVLLNGMEVTGGTIIPGETAYPTATTNDRRGIYTPPPEIRLDGSKALHLLVSLPNPGNIGLPDYAG